MRKLILASLLAITSLSYAQVFTQKVNPSESYSSANGVVYALPEVIIRLDVWIEKTEFIKGPYASYADRLLGISQVISSDYNTYKISNISISESQIPDPNQLYFMDLGELNGKTDRATFLQMNESGLFAGFTPPTDGEISNQEISYVEKIVKGNRDFRYYADANLVEKVDTIIRRVDIDTATITKAIIKRSTIEKDMGQRAQDAATYFMEIRKNRMELISGFQEVAYSAGALSLMNSELKQMEDDYLQLFAGKKLVSDEHYVFYYTPTPDKANIIDPIFKFSKDAGMTYLSASGGEKISIAIKSKGLSEKLMDAKTDANINGIVYRFPETAEVWVKYGAKEFDKQLMQIPQLGKLQVVNPGQNVFELHPSSGGIKVIEIRK